MSFLVLGIDAMTLELEKDQLEFEETIIVRHGLDVTEEISDYQYGEGEEAAESAYMHYLENQKEICDARQSSIESQLKVINSAIDGYSKAEDANIKRDCKLSISV